MQVSPHIGVSFKFSTGEIESANTIKPFKENENNKQKGNKKLIHTTWKENEINVGLQQTRTLFSLAYGKNATATFMSSQLLCQVKVSIAVTKLQVPLLISLWLTYCKAEAELWGQLKVMKGTVAQETVVSGPLVERSAN